MTDGIPTRASAEETAEIGRLFGDVVSLVDEVVSERLTADKIDARLEALKQRAGVRTAASAGQASQSPPLWDEPVTVGANAVQPITRRPTGRSGAASSRIDSSTGAADLSVTEDDEQVGYRGTTVCHAVGISYRQLDYWARTNLVVPTVRDASGSGTQRLYSFRDIVVLKVVKRLLDAGVSLQNIRRAIDTLRSRGVSDLAGLTLISDGTTVYECHSPEEVVDLLQGGQGVFGIAIGGALKEIQGTLAHLPAEPVGESAEAPVSEELAARRARRRADSATAHAD